MTTFGSVLSSDTTTELFGIRGLLAGLGLSNNGSDADHDIDIAVGDCLDENDRDTLMSLSAILVKRIDATFVVGTNQGGLDTGTVAADTWYYVHIIERSDTGVTDAIFSLSATSPTFPASYDKRRRIGAVLTDGSANILAFNQLGNEFLWAATIIDVDVTDQPATAVLRTLSTPDSIQTIALIQLGIRRSSAGVRVHLSSPDADDESPADGVDPIGSERVVGANQFSLGTMSARTNASGQVRTRASMATTEVQIVTLGWIDTRGRDD